MDNQEEILQQQQCIAGGAGQVGNTPPPSYGTPDVVATSYNVSVPVFSTMQPAPPPPPLVSVSQHQLAYQEAQAQHLQHVRERLRQFWANQMQEMKSEDLKKHNLPLAPINRIMKADKDVRMIAKETTAVFAKACEMFILDLTSQSWINTEEEGRRTVQNKDIAAAICKTDLYDFLEEVIPRGELKEQTLKAKNAEQHVGSSSEATIPGNNVPQQHGVGESSGTSSGVQQPPPFTPLYQPGPQSFVPGPQAQYQQNQQQPFMPWPQAQFLEQQPFVPWPQLHTQEQPPMPWPQAQSLEQQPFVPWPQLHTPEQPPMPWPQAQSLEQQPFVPWPQLHTPEQPPMPWLQDELIPDQQNPEQAFLSSSQDEEMD